MLNVIIMRIKTIDNTVCVALKGRGKNNDIVFLSHVLNELLCVVTYAVMPGNVIEIKVQRENVFLRDLA